MDVLIKRIPLYPNGCIAYSIEPVKKLTLEEWLRYIHNQNKQSKN